MTLLFSVPIQLALAHQAMALALLTATTLHAARMVASLSAPKDRRA
jgi:heme A synthase